jgi:MFS family permease
MGISTRLIDKKGLENVVILSVFMLALRWLLYFIFPNPYLVTGTFLLQGASIGLFFATANLFVRSIVDRNTLGTAITIFMAAGSLGGMFFQYISGIIIEKYSSTDIYLFFAILTFIALIMMFLGKRIKKVAPK